MAVECFFYTVLQYSQSSLVFMRMCLCATLLSFFFSLAFPLSVFLDQDIIDVEAIVMSI